MKEKMYIEQYTVSAEDLLRRNIEKLPCLVEPIFPKVGVAAIAGSSDTGKSTLMRQLCIEISSGKDEFLGFKIDSKFQRTLYVSTEDSKDVIEFLLSKQNKGLNLPNEKFSKFRYMFDTQNIHEKLSNILEENPHDLIVIDAFADLFTNDINQTNQVRAFLNNYSQLAEKHECLIVFVHHTGKASEFKAPNKSHLLGSQGFEAKMRTVIMLTKHKSKSDLRYFSIVKGNYIPEEYKNESLELRFDENMTFTRTGNVELTENLSKDENTKHKHEEIFKLKKDGHTQAAIAKQTGVSQSTVSRILTEI